MSLEKTGDLVALARMVAASHGGVTLAEIAERFSITVRTAHRWKERLLASFPDVEVVTDCGDRRHRWRMPRPASGGAADVSADQLAALDMAVAALGPGSKEAAELRSLGEEVRSRLSAVKLARLEADHEMLMDAHGLVARPGPRSLVRPQVDAAVSRALKASSRVAFDYASGDEAMPIARTVSPLGILSGPRRYLVALPDDADRVRIFRLDKIASVEVLAARAARPPDFDLHAFARRGFGAFVRDEEYGEVVWRFAPKAAERARSYSFHPDQVVEDGDDGSVLVRFHACGHLEMAWHLYSWGDQVEVVAPEALRRMVEGHRRSDFAGMP